MTSRGPVVEGEVDDVTVAFLEAEVDDVTAAAFEAEVDVAVVLAVQSRRGLAAAADFRTWLRSLLFTFWLPFRLLQPKLQVTATR